MKTFICLILLCAATLHAQTYSNQCSEFICAVHNSQSQSGSTANHGVMGGWLKLGVQSVSYTVQPGFPPVPSSVPPQGAPVLTIARLGNDVRLSWPSSATGFFLEENSAIGSSPAWMTVPAPYQSNNTELFKILPASQPGRFYRLTSAP